MGYQLAIDCGPGAPSHPSFAYQNLEDVLETTENAISEGYLEIEGGIFIFPGPGTVYKILSDEHIKAGMPQEDFAHFLVVTVSGGQIPPLGFGSKEEAEEAVKKACEDGGGYNGVLRHVARDGHEYNYICLSGGSVIMSMSKEVLRENQRRALEESARRRAEAGAAGGIHVPGIVIPGKN